MTTKMNFYDVAKRIISVAEESGLLKEVVKAMRFIDKTHKPDGTSAREYAEIEKALGSRIVEVIKDWVEQGWPPSCCICGGEGYGPEGKNDGLEAYNVSRRGIDWTHASCLGKLDGDW
jgi:hypothetical protein